MVRKNRLIGVLIVICGCSGDGSGAGGAQITFDTIGGVVHVGNSGDPPAWMLTPVVRIGTVESGPEAFGRIRSIIADSGGNVYVADNLSNEIRVFAESGEYRYSIGRKGNGPGEFGNLYSLAWLEGRLAALDPGNARITIFDSDGEWSSEFRHYPISGPPSIIRLHPVGVSGFYAPVIDLGQRVLPFVRFTGEGTADTIFLPSRPHDARDYGVICRRSDGGITALDIPDVPASVYGFPPTGGRIAVAWTETYQIAQLDQAGDTQQVIEREQVSIPYPDSLWDQAVTPYRELIGDYPGSRCEPSTPQRPAYRAALRHIVFDEARRMWVEAATSTGFTWDIFDREGRQLGRAEAPSRSTAVPPYVRGDHLYQVETDKFGVQYVGVYRAVPVPIGT